MKAYEERKGAKENEKAAKKDAKSEPSPSKPEEATSDGMMAGVVPGAGKADEKAKILPVTPLGRYIKVLISSNEFLFLN
jgi:hypothetical protein